MPEEHEPAMIQLSGYDVIERISEQSALPAYRARRRSDGAGVVLKVLATERRSNAAIVRLQHECRNLCGIQSGGVVRVHGLEDSGGVLVLVLEDFPGVALSASLAAKRRFDVGELLDLARQMASALSDVHRRGVTHGNLKPRSILVSDRGLVKLTDFGAITTFTRENEAIYDAEVIAETLPYISPEQTGRMNRRVDHRTDLYSLGVVLYEMLTRRRPFESADPMELVHAHLARDPASPAELAPGAPPALCAVVEKLLRKNAEDRYLSAAGLEADLAVCQEQWTRTGRIEGLVVGERDQADLLQIHQKLYGREQDVQELIGSFARVLDRGREIVLVSGYSGVGKSSLVQEILKPLAREKGYYISGKYDQYNRDTPYLGVIQAFDSLVRQLLAESEDRIRGWKERIDAALELSGQVICDVIPSLQHVVGAQPPVPALGPLEAQNRFVRCFKRFVSVFAQHAHPLALFLDDLQWIDPASLSLLKELISDGDMPALFFCGAYRNNEVSSTHPLLLAIAELEKGATQVRRIVLAPLALEHITELLSDSLRTREVAPLARAVLKKTGGNPFFVKQFIQHLHEQRVLKHDAASGWCWALDRIEELPSTDNVVDLMAKTLERLPTVTQEALKLAAAIGNSFDLDMVSTVSECSLAESYARLEDALQMGFIVTSGDRFRFAHDKIQEAAHGMISEDSRAAFHHRIGQMLLRDARPDDGSKLFDIVTHLNIAAHLIRDVPERIELARMNLRAAARAEDSAAFSAALKYVEAGIKLLPADAWSSDYELALAYHLRKGAVESLCEQHDDALQTLSTAFERARGLLDQTQVRRARMNVQVLRSNLPAALEEGLAALRPFGIDLPAYPSAEALIGELEATWALLGDRPIGELVALPPLADPEIAALQDVLQEMFAPCFFLGTNDFGITVMKILQNTIRHGTSRSSIYAFVTFGMLLCEIGDFDRGYEFGRAAVELNARTPDRKSEAMLCTMWGCYIQHWKEGYDSSKQTVVNGIHVGVETGQYIWAFYNTLNSSIFSMVRGWTLPDILDEARSLLPMYRLDKFGAVTWAGRAVAQIAHNLMNRVERPLELKGEWVDLPAVIEEARRVNNPKFLAAAAELKVVMGLYQGAYEEAAAIALENTLDATTTSMSWVAYPFHHFHSALVLTRAARTAAPDRAAACLEMAQRYLGELEVRARHCPQSFQHRYLILKGEVESARGNAAAAADLYDEGISRAGAGRFLPDEALGNELCAYHHAALGKKTIARAYLTEAHRLYARWGATEILSRLERDHPDLLLREARRPHPAHAPSAEVPSAGQLDMSAVLKALSAVSGEIVLPRLLERLMLIILQSAGATRGAVILKGERGLLVEAEAHAGGTTVDVLRSLPVEDCTLISAQVVQYVARTAEDVVASDASSDGRFDRDPHVTSNRIKSLLASPILRQGGVVGVIYLENNLTTDAFTPERIEVLRILSGQAAISIENALLYTSLEDKVRARTAELEAAHDQIMRFTLADQERQHLEMQAKVELIARQEGLIRMLSTPIIQVWDDVLTLPIVGMIDERRSADILQALLERVVQTQSRFAIIDLTGVDAVDTGTADRLLRIVRAVRLLGAQGMFTGIHPAVAQTVTSLGVDMNEVESHPNLREGIRACMRKRTTEASRPSGR